VAPDPATGELILRIDEDDGAFHLLETDVIYR
jgi:hypothetical protein